jgi:hypothetical protein
MREIGFLIWAIVVVAGVVSSIAQSARKRRAQGNAVAQASPARLAEVRRMAQQVIVNVGPSGQVAAPVRPAGLTARPPGPAQAVAPPQVPAAPRLSAAATPAAATAAAANRPVAARAAPEPALGLPLTIDDGPMRPKLLFSHLFGSRRKLADAFVVSEVLGKPLALRNE